MALLKPVLLLAITAFLLGKVITIEEVELWKQCEKEKSNHFCLGAHGHETSVAGGRCFKEGKCDVFVSVEATGALLGGLKYQLVIPTPEKRHKYVVEFFFSAEVHDLPRQTARTDDSLLAPDG